MSDALSLEVCLRSYQVLHNYGVSAKKHVDEYAVHGGVENEDY